MRFSEQLRAIRSCVGAGVIGVSAFAVGCDSGSAPEATPEVIEQNQKNEMEARQKAYGNKTGVPIANSKKAAQALQKGADSATAGDAAKKEAAPE